MAGWKSAQRHIKNSAGSASIYGKYYHWILMAFRVTIIFILSRRLFDKRIRDDVECDTETIGCQRMCHNFFVPMTVTRFWMYHLMGVASITIVLSAYKRKKYQEISEATAILELKNELAKSFPNHYLKPNFVHTVMRGECTDVAYAAVQNAYSFKKYDTPPRLFLWYYVHIWLMLIIDIAFTQRQRQIYSFAHWMPESFTCDEFPCENRKTVCYVSRSTEKSIMLQLHLGIVTLGIGFYVLEIYSIGWKQVAQGKNLPKPSMYTITLYFNAAWYRRHEDWTTELLLRDKPRFLRMSKISTRRGFLQTRKLQYTKRKKQYDSLSSLASTNTHSSMTSWL